MKAAGGAGEELILKNGVPAKRLYSEHAHVRCLLRKMLACLGGKILIKTVKDLICLLSN